MVSGLLPGSGVSVKIEEQAGEQRANLLRWGVLTV